MIFEFALTAIKDGRRVQRTGWNGKGMFVFLVPGSVFYASRSPMTELFPRGTEIRYHPHIDMKTAQGYVVPWVASHADLLAEDWEILPKAGKRTAPAQFRALDVKTEPPPADQNFDNGDRTRQQRYIAPQPPDAPDDLKVQCPHCGWKGRAHQLSAYSYEHSGMKCPSCDTWYGLEKFCNGDL